VLARPMRSSRIRKSNVRRGRFRANVVFPKGSSKKEAVNYEGARTEKDLVEYLNKQAGKHRLAGGTLDDNAGRIVDLDELAKKLAAATDEAEIGYVYTEVNQFVEKTNSKYSPLYSH
jgi:protein disulfide-isomerase A6